MHNSQFLNSISAYGERVYLTVTAYLQIENCSQPAILSKDLCVVIHGRDSRATSAGRSIRNIFSGSTFKYSDINRVTGVYELILRETGEQGSPGLSLCATVTVFPSPPFDYIFFLYDPSVFDVQGRKGVRERFWTPHRRMFGERKIYAGGDLEATL